MKHACQKMRVEGTSAEEEADAAEAAAAERAPSFSNASDASAAAAASPSFYPPGRGACPAALVAAAPGCSTVFFSNPNVRPDLADDPGCTSSTGMNGPASAQALQRIEHGRRESPERTLEVREPLGARPRTAESFEEAPRRSLQLHPPQKCKHSFPAVQRVRGRHCSTTICPKLLSHRLQRRQGSHSDLTSGGKFAVNVSHTPATSVYSSAGEPNLTSRRAQTWRPQPHRCLAQSRRGAAQAEAIAQAWALNAAWAAALLSLLQPRSDCKRPLLE